ncbi:MAG: hypothetical protein K2N28_10685 [Muribaculaceae bacterium]|nr:hypothetical protein [Muribaculaceae bacterium]
MKIYKFLTIMVITFMSGITVTSCSSDDDEDKQPGIVGTWLYSDNDEDSYDEFTLVFNSNHTGYIRNEYGSRAAVTQQMNFDWSLTSTSDGYQMLSVIYTSGDRNMDGPFEGGYAQYNCRVTIAGSTLSIKISDGYVMLFKRK